MITWAWEWLPMPLNLEDALDLLPPLGIGLVSVLLYVELLFRNQLSTTPSLSPVAPDVRRHAKTVKARPRAKAGWSRAPKRAFERSEKLFGAKSGRAPRRRRAEKVIELEHAIFWQADTPHPTPLISWTGAASIPAVAAGWLYQDRIAALVAANWSTFIWAALVVLVAAVGAAWLVKQYRDGAPGDSRRRDHRRQRGQSGTASRR
ncbi:MAG: hypothetical protein AAF471_03360 [Myxococcota bacterium]